MVIIFMVINGYKIIKEDKRISVNEQKKRTERV